MYGKLAFIAGFAIFLAFWTTFSDGPGGSLSSPKRILWDHNSDPTVASACKGVSFDKRDSTPVDPVISSFQAQRSDGEALKKFINDDDTFAYIMSLSPYFLPWVILFALFLISLPFLCCWNLGCSLAFCHYPTQKPTRCARSYPAIISLIALLGITILGIVGLVYASFIENNYNNTRCATFLLYNEVLYGTDPEYSKIPWAGMNAIVLAIDEAVTYIDVRQKNFMEIANNSLANNTFDNSKTVLDKIAAKYDSSSSPNYDVTNPLTGQPGYVIELRMNWKSYTSPTSAMYTLHGQREMYRTYVYDALKTLKTDVNSTDIDALFEEANQNITEIKDYIAEAEAYKKKLYNYAETGEKTVRAAKFALRIFYSAGLMVSVILIVGILLHIMHKWQGARMILQTAWIILVVVSATALLLTAVLFPAAVAMAESCDIIKLENLENDRELLPESVWNKTSVCLVGDGDLDKMYNITGSLAFANNLNTALSLVTEIYNEENNSMSYPALDQYTSMARNFRDRQPNMASPFLFTLKNPMGTFDSNNCQEDVSVWTSADCVDSNELLSASDPKGRCVPIKKFVPSNLTTFVGDRYSQCPESMRLLNSLTAYANDIKPFFTDLIADVNNDYKVALEKDNIASGILPLAKSAYELQQVASVQLQNLTKTMNNGLNCSFAREGYDRVYTAYCKHLVANVTSLLVITIAAAILDFVAVVFIVLVYRRWYPIPKRTNSSATIKQIVPGATVDSGGEGKDVAES